MATENLIDELLEDARERMVKSAEAASTRFLQLPPDWAGQPGAARPRRGGLLRRDDAAEPARHDLRPRSRLITVRQVVDQSDREGDQRVRHRPEEPRECRTSGGAGADRGAQARARQGRAGWRRRAGWPFAMWRCDTTHTCVSLKAEGDVRTTDTARRSSCRSSAAHGSGTWTACSRPRRRRSSKSDGRAARCTVARYVAIMTATGGGRAPACAHRPLPSVMMATYRATVPSSGAEAIRLRGSPSPWP